jgi:hypothetical protein
MVLIDVHKHLAKVNVIPFYFVVMHFNSGPHIRQLLKPQSSPFFPLVIFQIGLTLCLDWPWTTILLSMSSSGLRDMSQQIWLVG